MDEREDTDISAEESISDEISERVRSVISAAESAATAIRHEAEQQAQIKKRAAETERQRSLEKAKAEAEALLEERIKRISELSDSLIEGAEKILMRMEGAEEVKRQLDTMVRALAGAAEELAGESETPRPRMRAVPEPEPEPVAPAEPAPVTELHVPPREANVAEPVPEAEPEVTEADVTPAEAVVAVEEEEEVEVVDAVEVVDEPEPDAAPAVEGLRTAGRPDNGAPQEAEQAQPDARGFDGDDMLAARLVALQMAVAGSARDEVEAHLRKTFSLDEPGTILNDVFGTESKL
jgi:hypothetical protein